MQKPMHVSKNRLEGSLADIPLDRLIAPCERNLFTGTIQVEAPRGKGEIVFRAGAIDAARFGKDSGEVAINQMRALREGSYVIAQRLPALDGSLGGAAVFEGAIKDCPLVKIMRHCEDHALSCDVVVVEGFDRGEIKYRAGEITDVSLNGDRHPDAIVIIAAYAKARFRVSATPLDSGILGWPVVSREPTAPFKIQGPGKSKSKRRGAG